MKMEFDYVCLHGWCLGVDSHGNVFVFEEPKKGVKDFLKESFDEVFGDFKVATADVKNVQVPSVFESMDVIHELQPVFVHLKG